MEVIPLLSNFVFSLFETQVHGFGPLNWLAGRKVSDLVQETLLQVIFDIFKIFNSIGIECQMSQDQEPQTQTGNNLGGGTRTKAWPGGAAGPACHLFPGKTQSTNNNFNSRIFCDNLVLSGS